MGGEVARTFRTIGTLAILGPEPPRRGGGEGGQAPASAGVA